jgi:hypothetical protein
VSVITFSGVTPEDLGLTLPPPPYQRQFNVHGHTAEYLAATLSYNLPTGARSLVWRDGRVTVEVRGVGLSLREVLHIARGLGRADKSRFSETTKGLPIVDIAREMYGPSALEPARGDVDLTTYDTPDAPGHLVLTTPKVEGLDWLCVGPVVRTVDSVRGGGGSCVNPDKGFAFPTHVSDFPFASFVVGSFAKNVESVQVTADDGATYTATFHDTHEGKRPLVAVVALGTRRPGSPTEPPNATVVVTDTSGHVLRNDRIAI